MNTQRIQEIEAWSKVIAAIGQVLWPLVLAIAVMIFRSDLSSILKRLKKGKLLGQEVELDPQIAAFERSTEEAVKEVDALGQEKQSAAVVAQAPSATEGNDRPELADPVAAETAREEETILKYAAADPPIAVMKLGSLLEKELRLLAKVYGIDSARMPVRRLMDALLQKGFPAQLIESLRTFWNVRNSVVHGEDSSGALRILDTGLTLWRTLRELNELF